MAQHPVHVLRLQGRIRQYHPIHDAHGQVSHTLTIVDQPGQTTPQIAHLSGQSCKQFLDSCGIAQLPRNQMLEFHAVLRPNQTADILSIQFIPPQH